MICHQILLSICAMVSIFTLRLNYLVINVVGLTLNGANLLGYIRCRFFNQKERDHRSFAAGMREKISAIFSFGRHMGGGYSGAGYTSVESTGNV